MLKKFVLITVLAGLAACGRPAGDDAPNLDDSLSSYEAMRGYVDMYWDNSSGRLLLAIREFDEALLYQSSLARGIGSNDLGLDRGQLGSTKVVSFQRIGPKVLMVQENLAYRANSDDTDEARAVAESFARSVVWGFEVLGESDGAVIVDATEFIMRDSHDIVAYLTEVEEGTYEIDLSRSAVYMPRTKAFPENSELEAIVTYNGQPTGEILPAVVPDARSITVHLHHSFIRLPDDDYDLLPYEPRAGIIGLSYEADGYFDYASEIGDALAVSYGRRFRLQKKNPSAESSEAVKPIVYYVDRGAPEPIRSALIEGASWWNEAFTAAGYKNAFRVELMPKGADPMDVRYNVIQWVHRSTRGWSYGSSIVDPRTGEIIKGHVSLGSLRVRQDYLIAEGLLAPYEGEAASGAMLEMSLARIRQLSAHEVGHTIGMEHNFAASTQGRTSVMDYPFPLVQFDADGNLDLSDAYATGMGAWDHRTVAYAYQDFPADVDDAAGRAGIMLETMASGLKYVSDSDSRDVGTAHPDGNLWDNGEDALKELEHLMRVRAYALGRFSERNIRLGRPLATIEEALVPTYLLHRFQIQAAGKLVGGDYFNYAMRGDGQRASDPVDASKQRAAIDALLNTITPAVLRLPERLVDSIPARPPGHLLTRESFPRSTGKTFDPLGPARSAVTLTLEVLLNPERAARMVASHSRQTDLPGFDELIASLMSASWYAPRPSGVDAEIARARNTQIVERLMLLANDTLADMQVRAIALDAVNGLDSWLAVRTTAESDALWRANYGFARYLIQRMKDEPIIPEERVLPMAPPGSPIGDSLALYF